MKNPFFNVSNNLADKAQKSLRENPEYHKACEYAALTLYNLTAWGMHVHNNKDHYKEEILAFEKTFLKEIKEKYGIDKNELAYAMGIISAYHVQRPYFEDKEKFKNTKDRFIFRLLRTVKI